MNIGILQGRLSPSLDGKFQFFPSDWAAEFQVACELGFAGIEWLAYWPELERGTNPLLTREGRHTIAAHALFSGVPVTSVHGTYFRKYRPDVQDGWRDVVVSLIEAASYSTQRVFLIPLLEGNAPRNPAEDAAVRADLLPLLPALDAYDVTLAFETEMALDRLIAFVDGFHSERVGVCYDIGNCTSYGFDCPDDIRALAYRIKDVHIKDRKVGSSQSVTLSTGDADISGCVRALADVGWDGTLIMQAWRGQDYLRDAQEQLAYLQKILRET